MRPSRSALVFAVALRAGPAIAQRAWETPGSEAANEARALAQAGQCDSAIARFDAAIDRRPRDPELRRDRGLCHDQLGHPMPAIEDFRAYLVGRPKAPDAYRIQTRLDELEKDHAPKAKPPDHDRDGRVEPTKAPADLEDPFAVEESPPAPNASVPVQRGKTLVGVGAGAREWSTGGFADSTVEIGVHGSFEIARRSELAARVVYLRTGGGGASPGDADGFGLAALYGFDIGVTRSFELLLVAGAALEFQTTALDTSIRLLALRASPALRWNISDQISAELGPALGAGILDANARLKVDSSSEVVLHYGATAALLWRLGNHGGPKPGSAADPDAHEETDPEEPLSEDELWDD